MHFYPALSRNGSWLVRVLSLLLDIHVFRSISAVQLERNLNYKPIAWAEGVTMSLYQIVAAVCAVNGLGVWSFVLGTFVSGVVGLVFLYHSAPWPIRLCFDRAEMGRVLKHGVDRKSTRLNSSHVRISYAVFCLKKKNKAISPKLT